MKKAFLLIVLPALLVTLGFAQTPAPSANTDQTTIKGCLGGSDGNYTVVEDNTGHIFKVASTGVDLKAHLSQQVALTGHSASGVSSAPADSNFAVTELNMISEHCAAAAAPAATVSTPSEGASTPPAAATAPATSSQPETAAAPVAAAPPAETAAAPAAATPPAETTTAPAAAATPTAEIPVTPAADATPPAETPITRPAVVAAPVATANTTAQTASKPAARHRRPSHTAAAAATPVPDATASSSPEPASTPAAAATTPAPVAATSPDPASTTDAVATKPAAAPRSWSFWLWIAFAVVVVAIGTMFPFFSRWRKKKSLERTGAPNLSFTREVSSDKGKSDKQEPRKAA